MRKTYLLEPSTPQEYPRQVSFSDREQDLTYISRHKPFGDKNGIFARGLHVTFGYTYDRDRFIVASETRLFFDQRRKGNWNFRFSVNLVRYEFTFILRWENKSEETKAMPDPNDVCSKCHQSISHLKWNLAGWSVYTDEITSMARHCPCGHVTIRPPTSEELAKDGEIVRP